MNKLILGIDPGQTGALALIRCDYAVDVWDMPTVEKTYGKGLEVNAWLLADIIDGILDEYGAEIEGCVERVGAMPENGGTSMFGFGRSAGVIEGVMAAKGVRHTFARPTAWKRATGLSGRDKDAARAKAIELFPEIRQKLTRKKDVGRADALMIAHYAGMK